MKSILENKVNEILHLLEEGVRPNAIAEQFGVEPNKMYYFLNKHRIDYRSYEAKSRSPIQAHINEIVEAIENGEGVPSIAERFGITTNTLYVYLKRHHYPCSCSKKIEEVISVEELAELAKSKTLTELSDELGINYSTLRVFCKDHNITPARKRNRFDIESKKKMEEMILYLSQKYNPSEIIKVLHLPSSCVYNTIRANSNEIYNRN